jgi:nitrogen fixation protein FixH
VKHALKVTLAACVAAVAGIIALTIWVGARVKEDTVVSNPYEEGLRYDADRRARRALGWDVALSPGPVAAGPATIAFDVRDGAAPVPGASVSVRVGRPDTSRGVATVEAREVGEGRYAADVVLSAAGPWVLRFDVKQGGRRLAIEKVVEVATPCDLAAGPCTRALPGGAEVKLELGPRPLRTMADLDVAVDVRAGGASVDGAAVSVAFSMRGMDMGPNARALAPRGGGRYGGKAVLVRCPSGRRDWSAEVAVARPGAAPEVARFDLEVP